MMWKIPSVVAAVALVTVLPAAPAGAVSHHPTDCTIHVGNPAVVLKSGHVADVSATLVECPRRAIEDLTHIWWDTRNTATNSIGPLFDYQTKAIHPAAGLTQRMYPWDAGTYSMPSNAQTTYFGPAPTYTMYYMALKMTGGPIVAKLHSSVQVSAKLVKGKKRARQRQIMITASRDNGSWGNSAGGTHATLFRNGSRMKTLTLNSQGVAVFKTRLSGRWSVRLAETATHWSAVSNTVKK